MDAGLTVSGEDDGLPSSATAPDFTAVANTSPTPPFKQLSMFDSMLNQLMFDASSVATTSPKSLTSASTSAVDASTLVTIDAVAKDGDGAALLAQLQALGLQNGASYAGVASGQIAVSSLRSLANVSNIQSVSDAVAQMSADNPIPSEAAIALNEQDAGTTFGNGSNQNIKARFGVDGSGLTVGVLSNSLDALAHNAPNPFNNPKGYNDTVATNIAAGYLPQSTSVLTNSQGVYQDDYS